MTKREFMSRLEKELKGRLAAEQREDILSDFEEHFGDALLAGESEEDVANLLGDPREIAAQCVESGLWQSEPTREAVQEYGDQTADRLFVKLWDTDVVVTPGTSDKFMVELPEGEKNIRVDLRGRTFEVVQEGDPRRLFLSRLFRGGKTVYIEAPRSFRGEIEIGLLSGNINLDGMGELTEVFCETKSGNIIIKGVLTGETLSAAAGSGNVKLTDCIGFIRAKSGTGNVCLTGCKGAADASTGSGNVTVSAHSGTVAASAASGNVEVETDEITANTELKSSSGNVIAEIERLAANLDAKTVSGNVRLTVGKLEGNITGKTISGSVSVTVPPDAEAEFRLRSSGKDKQYFTGRGDNLPIVSLTTNSGSAKVHQREA